MFVSLIPRPSHSPVFDRLQYAKTGRRPDPLYSVNDVNVYLGRQREGEGGPDQKDAFCMCVLCF